MQDLSSWKHIAGMEAVEGFNISTYQNQVIDGERMESGQPIKRYQVQVGKDIFAVFGI